MLPCFTAASIGQYLYLLGGRDVNDTIIAIVDRYDTITNLWDTPLSPLPLPLSDAGAFTYVLNATLIYLVGGYDQIYASQSAVWVVDTSANTYSNTTVPAMLLSRGDIAVAEVDGKFMSSLFTLDYYFYSQCMIICP